MSISNDEVYVITPEVLSELKDCIAYADTLSCYKILSEINIVYYKHQDNSFELVTNSAKVEQPDKVSKQEDIAYIELKNLCLVYIDNKMYDEAKEIIDVLHKLNNSKLETLGLS